MTLLGLGAESFGAFEQLGGRHDLLWDEFKVEHSFVTQFAWPERFAEKVDRWNFVPRRVEVLADGERFVAIAFEPHFARAVVGVRGGNGRDADLLVIDVDAGTGRVAADGHAPSHAARLRREQNDRDQQQGERRKTAGSRELAYGHECSRKRKGLAQRALAVTAEADFLSAKTKTFQRNGAEVYCCDLHRPRSENLAAITSLSKRGGR